MSGGTTLDGGANLKFDALAEALQVAELHEKAMNQIMTLAIEFEAKTITADRFGERVCDIIKQTYARYVPK